MNVEVVDHDTGWRQMFDNEKQQLNAVLGAVIEDIHHIGSTSVNGLAAKPIIDIIIESPSLQLLDDYQEQFESLGYEVMGEYGIVGRRYYRKGDDNRTHQIHAYVCGDENVYRHLAFRDYLIAHPDILKQYEQLKRTVALECNNDIGEYCDGKDEFIKEYEAKAIEWKQNT